jgi:hypothetical protein
VVVGVGDPHARRQGDLGGKGRDTEQGRDEQGEIPPEEAHGNSKGVDRS